MINLNQHLLNRNFNYLDYSCYVSEQDCIALFICFDFNGQISGYQQYIPYAPKNCKNPKAARYFTRSFNKKQQIWGLEYPINQQMPIYIVEGVFKASTLHKLGFNSWAVLGSDFNKHTIQQLSLLPYKFITIGDDDKAGQKFAKKFNGLVLDNIDELSYSEIYKKLLG